jgi:hypothetical protein
MVQDYLDDSGSRWFRVLIMEDLLHDFSMLKALRQVEGSPLD